MRNVGQFLSTGTYWKTETCKGPQHDNPIGNAAAPAAEKKLPEGEEVPSYSADAQCNVRGLTDLGEYAVRGMMKRGMMLEIDHMSVKATGRVLDIFESESYPGVRSQPQQHRRRRRLPHHRVGQPDHLPVRAAQAPQGG